MILAALTAVALLGQSTAAEFFPMDPGMVWTYESTGDKAGIFSQKIGTPVDAGGKMRAPLLTVNNGKVLMTTFYDVTPSGVYVIGHEAAKLFAKPQPVFQFDPKGSKWEYVGPSPYEEDSSAGMRMTGQARLVGERSYLNEKRQCLEVKTETMIGMTSSTATIFKQTTVYAKGLGMVEMDETAQFGRRSTKSKVKLIQFERGGADNR